MFKTIKNFFKLKSGTIYNMMDMKEAILNNYHEIQYLKSEVMVLKSIVEKDNKKIDELNERIHKMA